MMLYWSTNTPLPIPTSCPAVPGFFFCQRSDIWVTSANLPQPQAADPKFPIITTGFAGHGTAEQHRSGMATSPCPQQAEGTAHERCNVAVTNCDRAVLDVDPASGKRSKGRRCPFPSSSIYKLLFCCIFAPGGKHRTVRDDKKNVHNGCQHHWEGRVSAIRSLHMLFPCSSA